MLNTAAERRVLEFYSKCRRISLTYLCFTHDLLIFIKGVPESILAVKNILGDFYRISELKCNPSKSQIFCVGLSVIEKQHLYSISGFRCSNFLVRCLGVPLITRKLKSQECKALLDRISFRIQHLASKLLSFARRLQLISSFIFSLQNYWSSLFILSISVTKEIE